jgi:nucleoside-diphosphate-sugar epimerase
MIYGHKDDRNISRLMRTIARYPVLPIIGSGDCLIQPVLIHDLIKTYGAVLFNATHHCKAYNIAGGKVYTNRELIYCAASGLGRKVKLIHLPAGVVSAGVSILSLLGLSPISREQVKRFQEDKNIDLSAFISNFGFVPHDFEQGVQLLIRDMKLNGLLP